MIDEHLASDTDFALVRQVRAECELDQTPIFVLGYTDTERSVWLRALQEGAEDYIQRPFNLAEVQLRVQNRIHFAQRYPALDRTCRSGKILTVDLCGGIPIHKMLVLYFEGMGYDYEFTLAQNWEQGFQLAQEELPHLVLVTPCGFAGENREECHRIRSEPKTASLPIICIVNTPVIEFLEIGVEDCLRIPMDLAGLEWRIINTITRSGAKSQ